MLYPVLKTTEIKPGEIKKIKVNGISIALICTLNNEYRALKDLCPHKGAPLSKGFLGSEIYAEQVGEYCLRRKGEILRCPWHSWEIDTTTGQTIVDPKNSRTKTYNISVEKNIIYIDF